MQESVSPRELLLQAAAMFGETSPLRMAFEAMPDPVMALNESRELVYCNAAMLDRLDGTALVDLLGMRPGQLLRCIHVEEGPDGCGSSESCHTCCVLRSFLESETGIRSRHEGSVDIDIRHVPDTINVRLCCSRVPSEHGMLAVIALADITEATRRAAIEKLFFHDVINVASALGGLAECVAEDVTEELRETASLVHALSQRLIEEIETQRMVLAAERDLLNLNKERIQAQPLLQRLAVMYRNRAETIGCELRMAPQLSDVTITTDRAILQRVLGNMIKMAMDASRRGDCITIGCGEEVGRCAFWAQIPRPLPEATLSGLFHGSCSQTMPRGKLSSYGMQLLNDRYLHGIISFTVSPEDGTRLLASYPLTQPD